MLALIMWHNRFSGGESEAVGAHVPRHRDSGARDRGVGIPGLGDRGVGIPGPRDSGIGILGPGARGIKFLWGSDPYVP